MTLLVLCFFATVIQVWGRLISGNPRNRWGEPTSLTGNFSSVVIDHFYGRGQDITIAGLYCDYLDRKEQTTSNILGAILKLRRPITTNSPRNDKTKNITLKTRKLI